MTLLLSIPYGQFSSMRMLATTFPVVLLNSFITLLSAPQGQLVQVQQWTSVQVEASHHDFSVPHMKRHPQVFPEAQLARTQAGSFCGNDPGKFQEQAVS